MIGRELPDLTRRSFLRTGAAGIAAWLAGGPFSAASGGASGAPEFLGVLPFLDEGDLWVELAGPDERPFGAGLGGRKIFELETLASGHLDVSASRFFLRTFRPDDLGDAAGWTVRLEGLLRTPVEIPVVDLARRARSRGSVLIECSGNSGEHHFGLIGSARWEGVSVASVLARASPLPAGTAIEVVGDDRHATPSLTSTPGASWIFTREQLVESGAFFATGMNGARLLRDHGDPLRLVVPGWYGCVCVKWVRALRFVSRDAGASSQMREFAARTHQDGVPERALDFQPATVDPAAMPVRVEAWRVGRGVALRIVGIAWGEPPRGAPRARRWSIRCDRPGEGVWRPLNRFDDDRGRHAWRLWSHEVHGARAGRMDIRCASRTPACAPGDWIEAITSAASRFRGNARSTARPGAPRSPSRRASVGASEQSGPTAQESTSHERPSVHNLPPEPAIVATGRAALSKGAGSCVRYCWPVGPTSGTRS